MSPPPRFCSGQASLTAKRLSRPSSCSATTGFKLAGCVSAFLLAGVGAGQAQTSEPQTAEPKSPASAASSNQTVEPLLAATNEIETLRAKIAEQESFNQQLLERLQRLESNQSSTRTTGTTGTTPPTTPASPAQQSPAPLPPAQPGAVPTAPPVTVATGSRFPVTISGLFLVQANAFLNESGPLAPQPNTFRLRRGQLGFSSPITPRLTGNLVVDLAKVGTNGAAPLQSLFLQYLLKKNANGSHSFDIGSFKVPLGYEGDINNGAIQTVERALMFRQRDQFGGGTSDISDTGAQLRGTFGRYDYRLGVFNGLGERGNILATGDNKAVVARLLRRFSPQGNAARGLTLGISGAIGNQRDALLGGSPSLAGRADRTLLNTFALYRGRKLAASAEYMTGQSDFIGDSAEPRDIRSYYASAGYLITPKVEAVLRYDYLNFDRNFSAKPDASGDTSVSELTLGFNYYIKGNNARIQTNIVRVSGGRGLTTANGFTGGNANSFQNDRTELRTQYQVAF